ncbi:hypothetical protein [Rhodococcus sp. RD6.2]|uniref:hypothetical protein n=1 Tax=Rhodococcus sp. RD6.2 TaxID=260936 RepID=UPI0012ED051C|nr:hypothetical protein [Rhodococcus sp. RD6.2]
MIVIVSDSAGARDRFLVPYTAANTAGSVSGTRLGQHHFLGKRVKRSTAEPGHPLRDLTTVIRASPNTSQDDGSTSSLCDQLCVAGMVNASAMKAP